MDKKKGILDSRTDLKKNPYSVPDGYFDELKSRLCRIPEEGEDALRHREPSRPGKLVPYLALVASFAAIFIFGTAILHTFSGKSSAEEEEPVSESVVAASLMPLTEYVVTADSSDTVTEAGEEVIEEYLISTGTSSELLAYTGYEESH
jgi:hypothetical protein